MKREAISNRGAGRLTRTPGDPGASGADRLDRDRFERLYDAIAPTIYAFLLKMLRSEAEAEDVLQETWMQAWDRRDSFDPARGNEIAWLLMIARSRAIDRLRTRRLRVAKEDEAGREISSVGSVVEPSQGFEHARLSEMRRAVVEAMREIPEEQRKPMELAYFQGLSHTEIAERLGEPLGTIKTRIHLAMKKLKERLGRFSNDLA